MNPSPLLPDEGRPGLLRTLQDEPERFEFDAAVAVMMRAAGTGRAGEAIRFHASTGLGFVASDVAAVERAGAGARFRVTTGLLGLTGPSGVLPRPFTDLVNTEQRRRSPALAAFLDVLADRPLANFAMAGVKYRMHRAAQAAAIDQGRPRPEADGLRLMALALTGYGTPHLASRLPIGTEPLLFYAGLFAAYPRSADRLAGVISDWLGQAAEVEQFDGTWLKLDPGERSALPAAGRAGQFNALGVDAAVGSRSWDLQSRIRIRLGPLPLDQFAALQPDQPLFHRLAALIRAYLGGETRFAINPVLAAAAVPPIPLGGGAPSRMGRNAWLPTAAPRRRDGTEAVFAADDIAPTGTARRGGQERRNQS